MTLNQIVSTILLLSKHSPAGDRERWYDIIHIVTRYYEMREGEELDGYPITVAIVDDLPWSPPTVIEEMYEDDLDKYHAWVHILRHMLRFVKEDNGFGFQTLFIDELFAPLMSSLSVASALDNAGGNMEEAAMAFLEPFKLSKAFDLDPDTASSVTWSL